MRPIQIINQVLKPFGAQLIRYPCWDIARRIKLFNNFKIKKIFDVGASTGSYSKQMKALHFEGTIISFEPISNSFQLLLKNTQKFNQWIALNYALGDSDMETVINISNNSDSSSLLEILPDHIISEPNSRIIKKERIQIRKLDNIFHEFYKENDNILLKTRYTRF